MTRYSREDVLSEREFELLLRGARELEEPKRFEALLCLYGTGALGLRAGELAHLDSDWINWPNRMIEIPRYDECTNGVGGGVCGYCRTRAEDYQATHGCSWEEALATRWTPKTETGERSIPFDFDVRVELCIEEIDDRYEHFPKSKATINRRVDDATAASQLELETYPHALRATAATRHASRNVSPYALMSVMGWQDMETARSYIAASDESAARELRSKHR